MSNKNKRSDIDNIKEKAKIKLKEYSKPEITQFGAMQRYTLGGSVGVGDSGMPMGPEQPPV